MSTTTTAAADNCFHYGRGSMAYHLSILTVLSVVKRKVTEQSFFCCENYSFFLFDRTLLSGDEIQLPFCSNHAHHDYLYQSNLNEILPSFSITVTLTT